MKKILSIIISVAVALSVILTAVEAAPANPAVRVHIDIGSQTMSVMVNGFPYAYWRVSTARKGYYTPRGSSASPAPPRSITPASMTIRRCPTRSSSTAAMPSTAPATSATSAAGLPRLRAPASRQCREALCARPSLRPEAHPHHAYRLRLAGQRFHRGSGA